MTAGFLYKTINSVLNPDEFLFKNYYTTDTFFESMFRDTVKISYPVDIKCNESGLSIDIAAVDVDKEEISIEIEDNNILKVSHNKDKTDNISIDKEESYIYKGIARRGFNFGWKILNPRLDLNKLDAKLEKGLLKIRIPMRNIEQKENIKKIIIK